MLPTPADLAAKVGAAGPDAEGVVGRRQQHPGVQRTATGPVGRGCDGGAVDPSADAEGGALLAHPLAEQLGGKVRGREPTGAEDESSADGQIRIPP